MRNTETLCTRNRPPRATVIIIDSSDPFATANSARLATTVRDEAEALSKESRLVLAAFSGGADHRFEKFFDRCSPGRANEVSSQEVGPVTQERRWQRKFMEPLNDALEKYNEVERKNSESYISNSIGAAVRNSELHLFGCERRLVVITDGLENTPASRVYQDGQVHLPDPEPRLLAGIDLVMVEFSPTETGVGLQSAQGRAAWRRWAEDAGARSVDIQAPGIPAIEPPRSNCSAKNVN